MLWFPCHASGIMSMTASGRESTPLMVSISSTLSKAAESEPPSSTMGYRSSSSSPKTSDCMTPSRARIQFLLPRSVLISPTSVLV